MQIDPDTNVYRHKKRGTEYTILFESIFQCSGHEYDNEKVVIYEDIDSGKIWVRPKKEFFDGRFEVVEAPE